MSILCEKCQKIGLLPVEQQRRRRAVSAGIVSQSQRNTLASPGECAGYPDIQRAHLNHAPDRGRQNRCLTLRNRNGRVGCRLTFLICFSRIARSLTPNVEIQWTVDRPSIIWGSCQNQPLSPVCLVSAAIPTGENPSGPFLCWRPNSKCRSGSCDSPQTHMSSQRSCAGGASETEIAVTFQKSCLRRGGSP